MKSWTSKANIHLKMFFKIMLIFGAWDTAQFVCLLFMKP